MKFNLLNKGEHRISFSTLEEGKTFVHKNFKLKDIKEAIYKLQDNFKLRGVYFLTLDELEAV